MPSVGARNVKALYFIFAVSAVLCGCARKAGDLEQRVQRLESKVTNLVSIAEDLVKASAEQNSDVQKLGTNLIQWMQARGNQADAVQTWVESALAEHDTRVKLLVAEELDRQLQARAAQFKAGTRPTPAPVGATRAAEPLRDGVPVSVYNQIAAEAAKEWPGNFTMQEWEIRHQIEAYRKLHPSR